MQREEEGKRAEQPNVIHARVKSHCSSSKISNQCTFPTFAPDGFRVWASLLDHNIFSTSLARWVFPMPKLLCNLVRESRTRSLCAKTELSQPEIKSGNVSAEYSQWLSRWSDSIRERHVSTAVAFGMEINAVNSVSPG